MKLSICSAWILLALFLLCAGGGVLLMAPSIAQYQDLNEHKLNVAISEANQGMIATTILNDRNRIIGLMKTVHLLSWTLIITGVLNGILIYVQFKPTSRRAN
jgi:hypothetical protein